MSLIWRRRRAPLAATQIVRSTLVLPGRPSTGTSVAAAFAPPSTPAAFRAARKIGEAPASPRGAAPQAGNPARETHRHLIERQTDTIHARLASVHLWARRAVPLTMRRSSPIATPRPEWVTRFREQAGIAPSATAVPAGAPRVGGFAFATLREPIERRVRRTGSRGPRPTAAIMPPAPSTHSHSIVESVVRMQSRTRHLPERNFRTVGTELRRERAEHIHTSQTVGNWNALPLTFKIKPRAAEANAGKASHAPDASIQSRTASSDVRSPHLSTAVKPLQQSSRATPAIVVDAALASRLADDVMRRIEQRLRIERERFGI
jgi:hypothetical protein